MKSRVVSIVIPTWKRMNLLVETLEHIEQQKLSDDIRLETLVISDGQQAIDNWNLEGAFDCKVYELGRNWSGLDRSSFGIAPLLVGYLLATGDYIMPWCDDERALDVNHIEKLVCLIETSMGQGLQFPDFVYPRVKIWRNGNPNGPETAIIGTNPPKHGQITHYLFRPDNFIKFGYPDWGTHPVDWSLIEKWMKNGAIGTILNEVTFEHRLDQ